MSNMRTDTVKKITAEQIEACVGIINSIPRYASKHVGWKIAVKSTAAIAACAINTDQPIVSARAIAHAAGLSEASLHPFIHGKDSGGAPWPELRAEIEAFGVKHLVSNADARRAESRSNLMNQPPAVITAPASFTVRAMPPNEVPPKAEAPSAAQAVKAATLAVKSDGSVTITAPPVAAVAPSTMIAAGGDFATKAQPMSTKKVTTDPDTGDFCVTVTTITRIVYGTAEHKTMMKARATVKPS
jgi:hypothetical protein